MELKDTIDGMISNDYRERFKAEYRQTKERYERLKGFCNRIEAAKGPEGKSRGMIARLNCCGSSRNAWECIWKRWRSGRRSSRSI